MNQTTRIGLRLKAARQRAGLTQYQLAVGVGLSHRQSVARIEDGKRSLSAEQFIRAMDLLGLDLEYFTDAFRLEGEGEVTFRTGPDVSSAVVDEFERRAGRWIAMYRELSREQGRKPRWLALKLALSRHSSFADADEAGEAFADRMELGDCPAEALRPALEDRLGILVLDVDAPPGVSGAAFRVQGLSCVLVNRREPEGHRNLALANGLFHLLTWDAIRPKRMEPADGPRRGKGWRIERLAESFVSGLLMPWPLVRRHLEYGLAEAMAEPGGTGRSAEPGGTGRSGESGGSGRSDGPGRLGRSDNPYDRLNEGAVEFRVSAVAYKRRLRSVHLLSREDFDALDDRRLVASGRPRCAGAEIPPFSREFVGCVATSLDAGHVSGKRAASVLDLSLPDLASLLEAYGHEACFEA